MPYHISSLSFLYLLTICSLVQLFLFIPNLILDTCLLPHTRCSWSSSRVFSPKLCCPKSPLLTIYSTATLHLCCVLQKMIRAISSHESDPRKDECKCQTSLLSHNYMCPIPNGANRTQVSLCKKHFTCFYTWCSTVLITWKLSQPEHEQYNYLAQQQYLMA